MLNNLKKKTLLLNKSHTFSDCVKISDCINLNFISTYIRRMVICEFERC